MPLQGGTALEPGPGALKACLFLRQLPAAPLIREISGVFLWASTSRKPPLAISMEHCCWYRAVASAPGHLLSQYGDTFFGLETPITALPPPKSR